MKILKLILTAFLLIALLACSKPTKGQVAAVIAENPEIIIDAIKKNPVKFMEAIQEASQLARAEMQKKRAEDEQKELEKSFDNPLKPLIRPDDIIRGAVNGKITVVEYSDFECPYCARGYETVKRLLAEYQGQIRFIYKHLPLQKHPMGQLGARYYEALRLQKNDFAIRFHDTLFENQGRLREGAQYFDQLVKNVGADLNRLKKDLNLELIQKRINEDIAEAEKFNISGTPGFILNGVPIKGAYPYEYFVEILGKLEEKGKLK